VILRGAPMNTASAFGDGIEGAARWSLRLFGGFDLRTLFGGERLALPGKRERVLLAYLALSPGCRQPRRKLAALLWGDATDETALDNLRTCIWSLRKALGDGEHRILASEGEDIVLDAAAFDVDVLRFCRVAAQPGRSELETAAVLASGEFLDGFGIESEEFEAWRRTQAARYRDQTIDVLTRLLTKLVECGEVERAIETGARILVLEPLHEPAVRRLMRLYGESGRRGAAAQLYRTLTDALRTELNAQPDADTRLVFEELTRSGEMPMSRSARLGMKLRPPSAPIARASNAVDGPSQLPWRLAVQRRAPLILLAALLIVVATFISYRQFVGTVVESRQTATAELAVSPQASAISIVVLPFANLSEDTNQEFFSDGITEEITSALTKVPNLRVVARTSAFQFKGRSLDVRTIARSLGASHLIEGSVRKVGNRVRISAELIEAGNGTNLWTESYERDFTDVFVTQENIAQAIAAALRVPLGLKPGDRLVRDRTNDVETYEQYLRARAILRNRNLPEVRLKTPEAIKMLGEVVARDPGYASAWGLLAIMTGDLEKKEMAAREAIRLDPRNGDGLAALGAIQSAKHQWAAAEDLRRRALWLDPYNPEVLDTFSNGLAFGGHLKEALSNREKLRVIEPFVPIYNYITATIMILNGQSRGAIPILESLPSALPRNIALSQAYAAQGRFEQAADALLLPTQDRSLRQQSMAKAARLLRNAPIKVKSAEALPAFDQELNFVYLYVGAPGRVLDYQERLSANFSGLSQVRYLWGPEFSPVRSTERFKAFVRKIGFVDYWRARGWPDLCHPVGADDFICT
jgi:TolB-like protein/DNA-binding SARP family transcriptional activator